MGQVSSISWSDYRNQIICLILSFQNTQLNISKYVYIASLVSSFSFPLLTVVVNYKCTNVTTKTLILFNVLNEF